MMTVSALRQAWLVTCSVGAMVAPIVPTWITAGVILLGLILLVAEKDRRYAALTWREAGRVFVASHQWSRAFLGAAMWCGVYGVTLALSHDSRGVYLACLGVYAVCALAAPRPAEVGARP
jgi:hypothetical protein